MNPLLDALGDVGYALDTPGALLRGLLAGNPGARASGTDLLDAHGLPGGPVGGFAAELALDPLALAGGALGAYKGLRGLAHADDANPLLRRLGELGGGDPLDRRLAELAGPADPLDALRAGYRATVGQPTPVADALAEAGGAAGRFAGEEFGAMRPFMEIGKRTDPDYINSVPWWHGSGTPGLTPATLDPMKTDPAGLFARGIYTTADPALAAIGEDSYAQVRARDATYHLANSLFSPGNTRKLIRSGDLDPDMVGRLLGPTDDVEYSINRMANDVMAGRRGFDDPEVRPLADLFRSKTGITDPVPAPTLYEAWTNLGRTADLDLPAEPHFYDALQAMTGGSNAYGSGGLRKMLREGVPASEMLEFMKPSGFESFDAAAPDALIQALRQAGYDALSHTGGLRAGGGRNLHQVLIALDPNDTVSKVGRSGQVIRFDPRDPEEILRLMAGGS